VLQDRQSEMDQIRDEIRQLEAEVRQTEAAEGSRREALG